MDQLLDFSKDIDTDLLDRIVTVFYSGSASQADVSTKHSGGAIANSVCRDRKPTMFSSRYVYHFLVSIYSNNRVVSRPPRFMD